MKSPREEPEPDNGDKRGIQTDQIQPNYWRSVSGRDNVLRCLRMS
jgi:hypothetical protein